MAARKCMTFPDFETRKSFKEDEDGAHGSEEEIQQIPEQLMGVTNELLHHLPPEPDQDRGVVIYYCPNSHLALWRLPKSALKDLPNLANLGADPTMIEDLPYIKRAKICRMLNVERLLGGDFKTLAGELGMTNQNIKLISERGNPTEEVLTWWETKKCATTHYFRQILQKMGRDDVVEELDRVHQPAQISYYNCHGQRVSQSLEREIEQLIRFLPQPENDDRILLFLLRDVLSALTTRRCCRNMIVKTSQISENLTDCCASWNHDITRSGKPTITNVEPVTMKDSLEQLQTSVKRFDMQLSRLSKAVAIVGVLVAIPSCYWLFRVS